MYMEATWSFEMHDEFHVIPHPSGSKTPGRSTCLNQAGRPSHRHRRPNGGDGSVHVP